MITTKITLDSDCGLLGVFLHPPGAADPIPLPGVNHTSAPDLEPGVYAVSLAGSGNVPGTKVALTFEATNSVTRKRTVRSDGTIIAWITFELTAAGEIK